MGRSGKLICTNDHIIYRLLQDQNYEIRVDGTIWTRVTKTGKISLDNIWRRAGSIRRGYATLKYGGTMLQVHRIIYAKFNGSLEIDLVVHHVDGNGCNNTPENLRLVTQSVNNYHRFRNLGHPPVMGNKVLNWDIVREIRKRKTDEKLSHDDLSYIYEISKGHISQIVNHEIWIEGKRYA